MKISEYRQKKKNELKKKAVKLYKQGMTCREVGLLVKMSHEWVAYTVREALEGGVDKSHLTTSDQGIY